MALVTSRTGQQVERFTTLVDSTGTTYQYIGEADPGTLTSDPNWSICRVTVANNNSFYADKGNFSQVWDNRAAGTYA